MKNLFLIWWVLAVVVGIYVISNDSSQQSSIWDNPNTPQEVYEGWVYADYIWPESISSTWDTVLFFHADWCPTCNQAQSVFEEWLPAWLTILKVDYDEEEDLKAKHQILTQTSYVYVAPDGSQIKRWVGWTTVEDVLEQIEDAKSGELKPREIVADENSQDWDPMTDTTLATFPATSQAYFAGWCFRCLDGPFDATPGVKEAIVGYIWWSADTANYDAVSWWSTQHREAVQVTYDPRQVSFKDLIATYFRQIDPTDAGGQFADRWFHYTTAIYYVTDEEKDIASAYIDALDDSWKFDEPIVVKLLPFPVFYKAEDYHQNYYLTNKWQYDRYKNWSWRAGFIQDTWTDTTGLSNKSEDESQESISNDGEQDLSHLTDLQYRVTQEKWTERPFDNEYRDNKEPWIYVDIIDGTPLFSSTDKFDSKTWWPSFTQPISLDMVDDEVDLSYGMVRTEVVSTSSDAHLWHIFNDGPKESWGKRYCINSAAMKFILLAEMEELGYGEWLVLFWE